MFEPFAARIVALPVDDIDTDQIIPARFLKGTDKVGLGAKLFFDWRYAADGQPKPEFVLNRPEVRGARGAQVLVAGDNFGCGSSREHAPWALVDYGFRAVVSTSFADIFRENALKNRLLPIAVPAAIRDRLYEQVGAELHIDLARRELITPDGEPVAFPIDRFAQKCLLEGVDQLEYLLARVPDIERYERGRQPEPPASSAEPE